MNNPYYLYPYANVYYAHAPIYNYWNMRNWASYDKQFQAYSDNQNDRNSVFTDHGNKPFVVNINEAAKQNNTYRTAIWTGDKLQVTLMSIDVGDNIGLEIHPNVDQFLRIEEGQGLVQMGKHKEQLDFVRYVGDDDAIMVPSGTWHNITNTGNVPLKLYSIYAPPNHPFGTIHETKADAIAAEG